ncbi:MAG: hypothetical protein JW982_09950 [Spirochaetes bacterium]|nr:hypothetical protein [Spirochaetota bacterium]
MFKKLFFLTLLTFITVEVFSADYTFAFGYLKNSSKDKSYDYLEKVFSNSLVSSFKGRDIDLLRASEIESELEKKDLKLLYEYSEDQLIDLCDIIDADYFMYGSFIPLDDYYVRLVISIYSRNTDELFTFETIGKLETEIFSLIDTLSAVLFNAASSRVYYKKDVIADNSKLSIITNLEASEMNEMYSVFMGSNFEISTVQSTDLENSVSSDELQYFYDLISSKNSLKKLKDSELKKETNFIYGSWMDAAQSQQTKQDNNYINFYYYDYPESKKKALENLSKSTKNNDYLLIIHFNRSRTKSFVRCIDFKTGNLIWMERNITADKESKKKYKSKIMQQTDEIIKHFYLTSSSIPEEEEKK